MAGAAGVAGADGACVPISAIAPAASAIARFSILVPYVSTGSFGET
jgi:hypothetical protein